MNNSWSACQAQGVHMLTGMLVISSRWVHWYVIAELLVQSNFTPRVFIPTEALDVSSSWIHYQGVVWSCSDKGLYTVEEERNVKLVIDWSLFSPLACHYYSTSYQCYSILKRLEEWIATIKCAYIPSWVGDVKSVNILAGTCEILFSKRCLVIGERLIKLGKSTD